LVLFILFAATATAEDYPGLNAINQKNWAYYFTDYLSYLYESHGCLHFTPSDIYLLTHTVPKGAPLDIRPYGDTKLNFDTETLPFFSELANAPDDVQRIKAQFASSPPYLFVYPGLQRMYIFVNDKPYAQLITQPGPAKEYIMAQTVDPAGSIAYDTLPTTPTDAGGYKILRSTDHYISNAYYLTTVVPFGAWIEKVGGKWAYKSGDKWVAIPDNIVADLALPYGENKYNYYDINLDKDQKITAARWAGNDFGKDVLLWTKDGKNYYPEMGYAEGQLLFEQVALVRDLAEILTKPGSDEIESLVSQNYNFSTYRDLAAFIESKGQVQPDSLDPTACSYYRLFNNLELSDQDYAQLNDKLIDAMAAWRNNQYPIFRKSKQKMLGLYQYLKQNNLLMAKHANFYTQLKSDWAYFADLRAKLREDFEKFNIYDPFNQQVIVTKYLSDRLEFKTAELPAQLKKYQQASLSAFFKPDEELAFFTDREKKFIQAKLAKAVSGETSALELSSVDALNQYNFGLLLNNMLGNLYKSHGCLHVSPRSSQLLYELLPLGARIVINEYSKSIDEGQLAKIPFLSELVNFEADLDQLKQKFKNPRDINIVVYPQQGYWIIYQGKDPLAKLFVLGGPKTKFYLLEARDDKGRPIFEETMAYPTTPGNFFIFKKIKDYVSSLYRDTTVIPQGGLIKFDGKRWTYQNAKGQWVPAPEVINSDLKAPASERVYTYYGGGKDPATGKVTAVRWGSHPFGTYVIMNSRDMAYPLPEFIHSSGDLILEQRTLVRDLIRILSTPEDQLDDCLDQSRNFQLFKACYDFIQNPTTSDLLEDKEEAAYKLCMGLPLASKEASLLYPDMIVAEKVLNNKGPLSQDEELLLVRNGLAKNNGGSIKIDLPKIAGVHFDTYQYVVAINKNAHHYEVLKDNWKDLSELRSALLKDFKRFVIKDPEIFNSFTRELMMKRIGLKRLDQQTSLQLLNQLLTSPEAESQD
jgi:hypothetical protein